MLAVTRPYPSCLPRVLMSCVVATLRYGENCSAVCTARGRECLESHLGRVNTCATVQQYVGCDNGCTVSTGSKKSHGARCLL